MPLSVASGLPLCLDPIIIPDPFVLPEAAHEGDLAESRIRRERCVGDAMSDHVATNDSVAKGRETHRNATATVGSVRSILISLMRYK